MDVAPELLRAADLAVATGLGVAGVVAWRWSRPVSSLLLGAAATWALADWWELSLFWHRALLAQLVLAYPGWWPSTRVARGVVGVAYVVCVLLPAALLDDVATVACGAVLVMAAWWNTRGAAGPARHHGRTAMLAAACFGGAMLLGGAASLTTERTGDAALVLYEAAVLVVAALLVVGLRPPSPDEVAGLVIELGDLPVDPLRDALSRATRDDDVRVGYWDDGRSTYVDAGGVVVDTARLGADRTPLAVAHDGGPFAVVVLDVELAHDPRVVRSVETAVRVVAVNARRTAALVARVRELEDSRRRLLEVADVERAVLDTELRAGLASRVSALSEEAVRLGDRVVSPHLARAAEHLARTATDLTDVAAGLRPRDLEDGLAPALARLAAECPLPVVVDGTPGAVPPEMELSVWYLCSEALANAAKHARATRVEVHLARDAGRLWVRVSDDGVGGVGDAELMGPGGLAGLRDRVTSYGGRLEVTSGPSGTTLAAELPLDGQPG